MIVYINNEPRELGEKFLIPDVLSLLAIQHTRGTAVAVNNHVVPRARWESFFLKENDKVTIIKATQGG